MQYADMNGHGVETEHFHERIHARSGHVAVQYRGRMLVWAGFMEQPEGNQSEYHNTDELIIYNSNTEVWSRMLTSGDIPPKNSGACGVVMDNCLYIYGGIGGFQLFWNGDVNTNNLYRLNLQTLKWTKLEPEGITPLPCDKLVGWKYKGLIYFFGGFGPSPDNLLNFPFTFVPCLEDYRARGWNNQLLCYDPDTNEWSWPVTRGTPASPRAAHSADISGDTVFLFGGRLQHDRLSSLHALNMDTMTWCPNLCPPSETGPEGRSWHSFTFINPTVAIVYGGFSNQSMILNDCWQLVIPELKWKPVDLEGKNEPRLWHQAVYLESSRSVVIVGGHKTSVFASPEDKKHADSLLKLHFEPKTLFRLCLNSAVENFQVTSPEWSSLPVALQTVLKSRLQQI